MFEIMLPVLTNDRKFSDTADVFFNTATHRKMTEQEPQGDVPPLRVGTIYENGPAWQRGLRLGDEIIQIGDTPVKTLNDVRDVMSRDVRVGESIRVMVHRGAASQVLNGARPFVGFGLLESSVTRGSDYLPIETIYEGGPAWNAGLRLDDEVLQIGNSGRPITSLPQVRQILQKEAVVGKTLRVVFRRPNAEGVQETHETQLPVLTADEKYKDSPHFFNTYAHQKIQ